MPTIPEKLLRLVLLTTSLTSLLTAQSLLQTVSGTSNVGHLGTSVAMDGDVDGDLAADLLVGAPGAAGGNGRIFLYYSGGGTYTEAGSLGLGFYGDSVAYAGDLDADGRDEILAASVGHYVRVINLAHPGLTVQHNGGDLFGFSVAAAGDTNGDGYADYIIGDPGFNNTRGRAQVFSGRNHQVLFSVTGSQPSVSGNLGTRLGNSVAGIGDVDRDGFDDIAIGSPTYDENGQDKGQVLVYSGRTWAVLFNHVGVTAGNRIGRRVAGVDDVNCDGTPDYAFSRGERLDTVRSVRVFSGTNGGNIANITNSGGDLGFGEAITGGDIDGDGFSDVVIGGPLSAANGTDSGKVWVVSIRNATELTTYTGQPGAQFGNSLSCGFRNANGQLDLAIGAPYGQLGGNPPQSGQTFIWQTGNLGGGWLAPRRVKIGDSSSTSTSTKVSQGWLPKIRTLKRADFLARGMPSNSLCFLVIGTPGAQTTPLAPGCTLWVGPSFQINSPPLLSNTRGVATYSFTPPSGISGAVLQYSWVALDPPNNALGIATSNGSQVIVGGQ